MEQNKKAIEAFAALERELGHEETQIMVAKMTVFDTADKVFVGDMTLAEGSRHLFLSFENMGEDVVMMNREGVHPINYVSDLCVKVIAPVLKDYSELGWLARKTSGDKKKEYCAKMIGYCIGNCAAIAEEYGE